MTKLMIVDDEVLIRTNIKNKIQWTDNLILCAEAKDGIEALQLALNLRPDIVITDVRMPEMNGISFIIRLKELLPDIQTIFISGYNEFDYVKSALELDSCAYVLKPIKRQELNAAIEKAVWRLEKNNMLRSTTQIQLRLLDSFLEGLYHGRPVSVSELESLLKSLHFHTSYYQLLLVRFVDSGDDCDNMEQKLNTAVAILSKNYTCRIRMVSPSIFAVFLTSREAVNILEYGKSLMRQLSVKYSMDVSIVLGQTCRFSKHVPFLFQTAKDGLSLLHLYNIHEIILPKQECDPPSVPAFPQNLARSLLDSIYTCNLQLLDDAIHSFEQWLYGTPSLTLYDIRHIFSQLLGDVLRILYERQSQKELINQGISLMQDSSDATSPLELAKSFFSFCHQVCASFQRTSSTEDIIRQAQQYIQTRYREDITLKKLAELYYLNISYFSLSFKSVTGKNFNEYLTSVRMEHAKQFLQDKNMKINEAARMAGYEDMSYFGKLFRKYTGMTPKEYRTHYLTQIR